MALINFGGITEQVIMRKEFPMSKARRVLKNETIAVIGYGVQGPAQSLNMKDNGFKVIVGQARSFKKDWDRARKDGWKPGKSLFDIAEATQRGTITPTPASRTTPTASATPVRPDNRPSLEIGRRSVRLKRPRPGVGARC